MSFPDQAKNAHPDTALGGNGDEAQDYFASFFVCFMVMFTMTGIGNGSTFKMVPPMQEWTNMVQKTNGYEDLQTTVTNPKVSPTQARGLTPFSPDKSVSHSHSP